MAKKAGKGSRERTIKELNKLQKAAEEKKAQEEKAAKQEKEAGKAEEPKKEEPKKEGLKKEEAKAEAPKKEEAETKKEEAAAGDKQQDKIGELNDKLMRQMAEFDNFRKRSEKEKAAMFETGARSVIEKLLPVVDNFERGLAALSEEEAKSAFAEGVKMVYKQLMDELDKLEVKPIEAVGKEFDPNLHNAVMHVDDGEAPDNTVVEEFQKGYTYRGTVVRHSMVKVAN